MIVAVVIVIIIVLAIDRDKKRKRLRERQIRCDGCQEIINGKFIRVTEAELSQPLDYCTQECKNKHITRDRIKFSKQEVI